MSIDILHIFTLTKLLAVQSEAGELYCTYVHHD